MGFTVVFDGTRCQGYANCLIEAPGIWDFDEDNDTAVLLDETPGEEHRAAAEASARCCPANAIAVKDPDA